MKTPVDWIAVDWGSTRLRAWAVDAQGRILDRSESGKGMLSRMSPDKFEPALLDSIGGWLKPDRRLTVIACGMVGARQGWVEAPYIMVPARPPVSDGLMRAPVQSGKIKVLVIPGMSQNRPADVMRGEETIISGFLRDSPNFKGMLCLTGTHTKWVEIGSGKIRRFQTFMSGELFSLLSQSSLLRHSVPSSGWDDGAFTLAVSEALAMPANLTQKLFSLRAQSLLQQASPETARAHLSGLLIGTELSAVANSLRGHEVIVIGDSELTNAYAAGLELLQINASQLSSENLVLAGLKSVRAAILPD